MVAASSSGQPAVTTRVGSPSVWESTTSRQGGKIGMGASAELDGAGLGVEVAGRAPLFAAA